MPTRKPNCYCVIDGGYLPVLTLDLSLGSNGSLSTVRGTSSLTLLANNGIDIYAAGQMDKGASIQVYLGFDQNSKKKFSGVLDESEFDIDGDSITFSGRDNAAALTDTKEVTTKINYKNQTIGQIVTQIANVFNLTPLVTEPGLQAGPTLWDSSAYMPHGQEYWSMLQDLAEQVGYECFVTENDELFFGPTELAGGSPITVTHGSDSTQTNVQNPIIKPVFLYQPRKNANIEVNVISYHPIRGQLTKSVAKGVAQPGGTGSKIGGSYVTGTSSGQTKSGGGQPSTKPIVVRRRDGLTQEAADALAQSMAKDIAKREIIFKCKSEGLLEARQHSPLKIVQGKVYLFGFDKRYYIIATVNHHYSMTDGFTTDIEALTKPTITTN